MLFFKAFPEPCDGSLDMLDLLVGPISSWMLLLTRMKLKEDTPDIEGQGNQQENGTILAIRFLLRLLNGTTARFVVTFAATTTRATMRMFVQGGTKGCFGHFQGSMCLLSGVLDGPSGSPFFVVVVGNDDLLFSLLCHGRFVVLLVTMARITAWWWLAFHGLGGGCGMEKGSQSVIVEDNSNLFGHLVCPFLFSLSIPLTSDHVCCDVIRMDCSLDLFFGFGQENAFCTLSRPRLKQIPKI